MMEDNSSDILPEMIEAPEPEPQPEIVIEQEPEPESNYSPVNACGVGEKLPEEVIEPKKKEKLKQSDIFISTPSSKKNIEIEKIDELEEPPPKAQPIKPIKKKRVMSESHKQKLAEARKKGYEVRMKNTQLRKEKKEREKQEQQEEKEIKQKIKVKKLNKLKQELYEDEPEEPVVKEEQPALTRTVSRQQGYTQEQLNQAILSALESNENQRKVRKAEKKKRLEEEQKSKKIFNTISNAINPQQTVWDDCFG